MEESWTFPPPRVSDIPRAYHRIPVNVRACLPATHVKTGDRRILRTKLLWFSGEEGGLNKHGGILGAKRGMYRTSWSSTASVSISSPLDTCLATELRMVTDARVRSATHNPSSLKSNLSRKSLFFFHPLLSSHN